MSNPSQTAKKATRQCWECLKRRLVCDYTLPRCQKCLKTNKECPGYGESKPLQWVVPRKATSRRKEVSPTTELQSTLNSNIVRRERDTAQSDGVFAPVGDVASMTRSVQELSRKVDGLYKVRDGAKSGKIQCAISPGLAYIIDKMVKGGENKGVVEARVFEFLTRESIPRYDFLNETSDIVQAVSYYNTCVYPHVVPLSTLTNVPSTMVYFPMAVLHLLPHFMHSVFVCWSLNHRINTLGQREGRQLAKGKWQKVYGYRGAAIKELTENISKEEMRCSDVTVTGIFMFLCLELQMSVSANWRTHADGLMSVIEMRGGLMTLFRSTPHLRLCLAIFNWMAVYSNTMTLANAQIMLAPSLDQKLSDVTEMYEMTFPFFLSPPIFLLETVRISNLRARWSTYPAESINADMVSEAYEILARIEDVNCEIWAQENQPHLFREWSLIGRIFQAAVAIYCIMSLQSIGILPIGPSLMGKRAVYGDQLVLSLRSGLKSPHLKNIMTWPLVVAGAEAGYRTNQSRLWIERQLEELAMSLGTCTPLKAKALLDRYWSEEVRGWDECFHGVHCFAL